MGFIVKTIHYTLTALLLCCSLSACPKQEGAPARIAFHPWIGYESLALCQQERFIDPKRVELVPSQSLSHSSDLLRNGSVDAAALTLDEVLKLRQEGVQLTVILIFDLSVGADIALARPGINDAAQLKGKTIGLEQSALGQLMLTAILERAQLDIDQVHLHYCPVPKHGQLWQESDIDALITYLPLPKEIRSNAVELFDSRQLPNTIRDVLAVRSDRLEALRPAWEHILKEHFHLLSRLLSEDPDTLHRLACLLGYSIQQTAEVLRKISFPCLKCNRTYLNGTPEQMTRLTSNLIRIMQRAELLSGDIRLDGLVDNSFLPRT
ncbi:MAG: ABC transporter substrate-binding protein [Desulfuromonadaceae bacterium]|nr:ABC transporter substrate-binding protein [Desulfuromonadaceae bacterium]